MRTNLGRQAVIAILLGIVAGFFFGPYCDILKPIGNCFFVLLQMVVLPYIPFLLMHGLGSLNTDIGKKLFRRGWVFFFLLWGSAFAVIYLLIYLIPTPITSFIETIKTPDERSWDRLFTDTVPQNFFTTLTQNIVPAVAIFGIVAGAAIMHLRQKELLLNLLERGNAMIEKILDWLAFIAPIPIFAHVASTVGTLRFENLAKVEFYIIAYISGILFLVFCVLPIILTNLTHFSYREAIREYNWVCWVPFATAIPSLAFPFMYESLKRLGKKYELESTSFHNTGQTVLPLTFTFAQIGNFFMLFFIFFLSFYTRHPIDSTERWVLPFLTLPLSFGTVYASVSSVSFLMDKMHFPIDAFTLFQSTSALTINFQVLLSVAGICTLTILILTAYYGLLRVRWLRLLVHLAIAFGAFGLLAYSVKGLLPLQDNFTHLYGTLKMPPSISEGVAVSLNSDHSAQPLNQDPLSVILAQGILRVGYNPVDVPYCYFNNDQELVGYDVAFAYQLAKDLDCRLELVPLNYEKMIEELEANKYDIVMSGIVMDEDRLKHMEFVQPYLEQNNVLIVPVAKREEFLNLAQVQGWKGLKIGAIGAYEQVVTSRFPFAELIPMGNADPLLEGKSEVMLWSYLSSFIWCLNHPDYTVLDYNFVLGKKYISYPVRSGAQQWLNFVQNWVILKEQAGFSEEQYRYWIKGERISNPEPRWSILRNVLHWVD